MDLISEGGGVVLDRKGADVSGLGVEVGDMPKVNAPASTWWNRFPVGPDPGPNPG